MRKRPASPPPCASCPRFPRPARDGLAGCLSEYAQLHLLARAHERLDTLPPDLAATVRSRVGYPTSRKDVLTRPAVTDHWAVLGVRDLVDGTVPGRRIWLRGRDSGQWAMLLTFSDPDWRLAGSRYGPAKARHRTPRQPAFYPGQPPMRAVRGSGTPSRSPRTARFPPGTSMPCWRGTPPGLEQDPWLTWLALLTGTPPERRREVGGWHPDRQRPGPRCHWRSESRSGRCSPCPAGPVAVAAEWHPDGLLALTVWHGDRAVAL